MEELKKANSKLRKTMGDSIVNIGMMCLQLIFITCGVAYFFAVGGLLVKLLAAVISTILVTGGAFEISKNVKIVKSMRALLKIGDSMEDLFGKHSEDIK